MSADLFPLGMIVATRGALELLEDLAPEGVWIEAAAPYILRHVTGDWGELSAADWKENRLSVKNGYRILSAYSTPEGRKLWVITEADRSATTILLPEEY